MSTSPGSPQLQRGIRALAVGSVLAAGAIALLVGLGAAGAVRVSIFGLSLPDMPVWFAALIAGALAAGSAAALGRGYRSVWGRRGEARELSARAESLRLRNALLEARGEQLAQEALELRGRRDRARRRRDGDVLVLPDPEEPRRGRRRAAERLSE